MANIYHQVSINAPAAKIYEAISTTEGVGTWWDEQTPIPTDEGLVLERDRGPEHGVLKLRIVELVQDKRIVWECISNHPDTSPFSAWTETYFIFEIISGKGKSSLLDFRHSGYDEDSEFYGSNNFAWGQILQNLKKVVEL